MHEQDIGTLTMRECNGLAFIGDPHLCSVKPGFRFGRRTDADYRETIFKKLEFIVERCNENRWVPVFLGDMFDNAIEPDESTKVRLLRLLKKFWVKPVGNIGNHDKTNKVLSDSDSLMYIYEAGGIDLAFNSGALDCFIIGGRKVGLGATPYDQVIPLDARKYLPSADSIVWITHHDLAFDGAYPGSSELHSIRGCKLAVNGHMHIAKPIKKVGETSWFNPGNIVRQAIDAMEHEPAFNVLTAEGKLQRVIIPHEKSVFDLTGKLIDSISPGEQGKNKPVIEDSAFVAMLSATTSMEMPITHDGSILLEDIVAKFDKDNIPDMDRDIILQVHKRSLESA